MVAVYQSVINAIMIHNPVRGFARRAIPLATWHLLRSDLAGDPSQLARLRYYLRLKGRRAHSVDQMPNMSNPRANQWPWTLLDALRRMTVSVRIKIPRYLLIFFWVIMSSETPVSGVALTTRPAQDIGIYHTSIGQAADRPRYSPRYQEPGKRTGELASRTSRPGRWLGQSTRLR